MNALTLESFGLDTAANGSGPDDPQIVTPEPARPLIGTFFGGSALYAASGETIVVNEPLAELIGTTLEVLRKQNFRKVESWKRSGLLAAADAALAEMEPKSGEFRFVTSFGKEVWLAAWLVPFECKSGAQLLAAFTDLSGRHRAEQALRASEEAHRDMLENMELIAVMLDTEGRVVFCNRCLLRLTGREHLEVIGADFLNLFVPPEEQENLRQRLREDASRGEILPHLEFEIVAAGGERRMIRWSNTVRRDATGAVVALASIGEDITEVHRAAEALRVSEKYHRALSAHALDVVTGINAEGKIISESPSVTRVLGYGQEELVGENAFGYIHPEDRQRVFEKFVENLPQYGQILTLEYRFRHKDGSWRVLESVCANLLHDADLRRVVVNSRDITERRAAEAQVRALQRQHALILASMGEGVFGVDLAGKVVFANPAATALLAPKGESLLGEDVGEILHCPVDGGKCCGGECPILQTGRDGIDRMQTGGVFWSREGTSFQVKFQTSAIREEDGSIVGTVVVFRDISLESQAEAERLLQSAALNAAANAIMITDAGGTILWVNAAFSKLTGYSREEAVGADSNLLKSGEHPREFYSRLWLTISAGDVWQGEMRNRRKDGSVYDEEMVITPVKDEGGVVTHYISVKQDISARKLLEAQCLRSQRMEAIGALAGGIAHDLNNALAPILMGSEILGMQCTDPKMRHILDAIDVSAQRGAAMVRQILTFARGTGADRGIVQVSHLLADMTRIAKQTFPKDIAITVGADKDIWNVEANPTQLHQVILNLSVNARDAMPHGGTLTLSAQNVRIDEAFARMTSGAKPGSYVLLSVTDTGTGMPPEVRTRIFEPFFSTKPQDKGTGLGLSTVRTLVEEHGGFIELESAVGRGTQFKIYLPALENAEAAPEAEKLAIPLGNGELILVVDDEATILSIATQTLEPFGYRTLTASNGVQAVAVAAQHLDEIDLAILDIQMPVMGGVPTSGALRALIPRLKVVLSSGESSADDSGPRPASQGEAFLHKPYRAEDLLRLVSGLLHSPV